MMRNFQRFILTPSSEQPLPLYVESIGYNPDQEKINRNHGYPFYHWIQTEAGEGVLTFEGKTISLPVHTGVLLLPGIPHLYEAASDRWETLYLTFSGPAVAAILESLQMHASTLFRWEKDTPLTELLTQMLERVESEPDVFGLNASLDAYRFMIMLGKYGQLNNQITISSNLSKLQPLIDWMDVHYSNPDMDLDQMAAVLNVSPRRLNTLFRATFSLSPYAYFLLLRIRKAKEILISRSDVTIKHISLLVGFRDVSHFVATFRKYVGMTPEQFRHLY
jgi:AraC-like DNA-binding protein